MKKLYIDFDGVIMNTIEVTYKELKELKIENNPDKIKEYYIDVDWNDLINNRCSVINDGIESIKRIIESKKFNVSILTHIFSLEEAVQKINYIRKYFDDITVIPVPKSLSKTKMVNTADSILIDDFSGNLREWEKENGIGVKFSSENDSEFPTISRLDSILSLNF